ncbi:hypothetical protein ES703_39025 [subsurface metagenome]
MFTAGGVTSLVLGSLLLFPKGGGAWFQVDPWLIAVVAIGITAFFVFAVSKIIGAHRRQAKTGREDLIGKTAKVQAALESEEVVVLLRGERWTAVLEKGRVKPGEEVIVTKVDGLKLYVTKKNKEVNK